MLCEETKNGLNVILIRHGERADEILKKQGIKVARADKLDPVLSENGYFESRKAGEKVFGAICSGERRRKVSLVSAPMRRTCGSALMASASLPKDPHVTFGFQGSMREGQVPILILNSLSACATQVRKQGPMSTLLQNNRIPCADHPINDGSMSSPMAQSILDMQKNYKSSDPLSNSMSVQFCGVDAASGHLAPLAPPMTASEVLPSAPSVISSPPVIDKILRRPYREDEEWTEALDRAAHLSMEEGCDTMIVYTHREAIVGLITLWENGVDANSVATPHCCVGSFHATPTQDGRCQWKLHALEPYMDFSCDSLLDGSPDGSPRVLRLQQ